MFTTGAFLRIIYIYFLLLLLLLLLLFFFFFFFFFYYYYNFFSFLYFSLLHILKILFNDTFCILCILRITL